MLSAMNAWAAGRSWLGWRGVASFWCIFTSGPSAPLFQLLSSATGIHFGTSANIHILGRRGHPSRHGPELWSRGGSRQRSTRSLLITRYRWPYSPGQYTTRIVVGEPRSNNRSCFRLHHYRYHPARTHLLAWMWLGHLTWLAGSQTHYHSNSHPISSYAPCLFLSHDLPIERHCLPSRHPKPRPLSQTESRRSRDGKVKSSMAETPF